VIIEDRARSSFCSLLISGLLLGRLGSVGFSSFTALLSDELCPGWFCPDEVFGVTWATAVVVAKINADAPAAAFRLLLSKLLCVRLLLD
jgi:hypothetical protein